MIDKNNKLRDKAFLENELQKLNEMIHFIKLNLREIDDSKYNWLWNKFSSLSLFCKRLWLRPLFRLILLGTSTVILSFSVADYFNLFEFLHSAPPVEEAVTKVDPPQKLGLFSRIKNFIKSVGAFIYKAVGVVLLVSVGAIGSTIYDNFYNSEDMPFGRTDIETTPEADTAPEPGAAPEESAPILPKKNAATQTIEASSSHDSIETPQTQRLIERKSERSSSILEAKLKKLIANDSEDSGLKGVQDLQDQDSKDINDLVYKAVANFLNFKDQGDTTNNSNLDKFMISCEEEKMLDVERSDSMVNDGTRGAIEKASSSISQKK